MTREEALWWIVERCDHENENRRPNIDIRGFNPALPFIMIAADKYSELEPIQQSVGGNIVTPFHSDKTSWIWIIKGNDDPAAFIKELVPYLAQGGPGARYRGMCAKNTLAQWNWMQRKAQKKWEKTVPLPSDDE